METNDRRNVQRGEQKKGSTERGRKRQQSKKPDKHQ